MLTYHSRTFELLGAEPLVSPAAREIFKQVEQRIGRVMPASVREWYELDGAGQLLLRFSNDDPPLDIVDFGKPLKDTRGGGPHDLLERNLLVFRWENQGVCAWAIQLDGSDDPPVVVDVDTQFSSWVQCAPSFSQHLYGWMWDHALVLGKLRGDDLLDDLVIEAQNQPLSQEALSYLRSHFEAELVTHGWPGDTQYRFFIGDQRILIWAGENHADWFLSAKSEEALGHLANLVSPLDGLAGALFSNTEAGQALLRRVRGSTPRVES